MAARREPLNRAARALWTTALLAYLVHVVLSFNYFYGWSHAIAYRETARQTRDLFGVDWGGGIYLNYLFTAVWIADCAWWWNAPERYGRRASWIRTPVHVFLAFMFVNASLVVWAIRAYRSFNNS